MSSEGLRETLENIERALKAEPDPFTSPYAALSQMLDHQQAIAAATPRDELLTKPGFVVIAGGKE